MFRMKTLCILLITCLVAKITADAEQKLAELEQKLLQAEKNEQKLAELEHELDEYERLGAAQAMAMMRTNNLCLGGLKSRYIKDGQLKSSGYYSNLESHGPQHGRLDSNTGVGGWAAAKADKDMYQWIQVDLMKPKTVYGVMIQGRGQIQQWVTKFKVQYGNDEKHLEYVKHSRANPVPMVFPGATDPLSAFARRFPRPIPTRFIRIVVADFYVHPCLRFDILHC